MKSLTGEVGLKVGPLMLEVLVKHWFDRRKKDNGAVQQDLTELGERLKDTDFIFHEAFVITKVSPIYLEHRTSGLALIHEARNS